jgi:hypothetical protein
MKFKLWLETSETGFSEIDFDEHDADLVMQFMGTNGWLTSSSLIDSKTAFYTKPFIYLSKSVYGKKGGVYVGEKNTHHETLIYDYIDIDEDLYDALNKVYNSHFANDDPVGGSGRIGYVVDMSAVLTRYEIEKLISFMRSSGVSEEKLNLFINYDEISKGKVEKLKKLVRKNNVVSLYYRGSNFAEEIVNDLLRVGFVRPDDLYLVKNHERGFTADIIKVSNLGGSVE